jgi:hypothetical protein
MTVVSAVTAEWGCTQQKVDIPGGSSTGEEHQMSMFGKLSIAFHISGVSP